MERLRNGGTVLPAALLVLLISAVTDGNAAPIYGVKSSDSQIFGAALDPNDGGSGSIHSISDLWAETYDGVAPPAGGLDRAAGAFEALGIKVVKGNSRGQLTDSVNPVPEPATLLLFGSGLIGIVPFLKRRRNISH